MFNKPIQHVRLKSFEELMHVSMFFGEYYRLPKTMTMNLDIIVFTVKDKRVYVTPYREEIWEILVAEGYEEDCRVPTPTFDKLEESGEYKWLKKIAEEENWAYTYELAYEKAKKKGIKAVVDTPADLHVKEFGYFEDKNNKKFYFQLISMFLEHDSKENIGTYIVIDDKTVVLCDEYGRTYHVRAKKCINDLVNKMIDAGYTRTHSPHNYVGELKDEKKET